MSHRRIAVQRRGSPRCLGRLLSPVLLRPIGPRPTPRASCSGGGGRLVGLIRCLPRLHLLDLECVEELLDLFHPALHHTLQLAQRDTLVDQPLPVAVGAALRQQRVVQLRLVGPVRHADRVECTLDMVPREVGIWREGFLESDPRVLALLLRHRARGAAQHVPGQHYAGLRRGGQRVLCATRVERPLCGESGELRVVQQEQPLRN
mmetsp:Transcript_19126/g.42753  ORF Transcript_19126/g.42753 Transcript_19126/m.42753 type:complete len:205 (-) Transcript_19126:267-881(-)